MLVNWSRAARRTVEHLARARRRRSAVVFLDQRWPHHGRHSGYLICDHEAPKIHRDDRILPYPLRRAWVRLTGDEAWESRLLAHLALQVEGARVLHVVDGDFDTWVYCRRPGWLKARITATFHQTPDRLADITTSLRPGMLEGIVCVSREQLALLRHLVPEGRCVFIPHGVDTEFFAESEPVAGGNRPVLLAVGVHRRDYPTLVEAARIIKGHWPDARVRLIAPRDAVARAGGAGVLDTSSDLDDQQLRAAYREATLLLLPLEAATANNALLESMASGRPAVITDLPAIRDYTASDAAIFCPAGDAEAHARAALELLADPTACERMGRAARRRAVEFSWPRTRAAMMNFLQEVTRSAQAPLGMTRKVRGN